MPFHFWTEEDRITIRYGDEQESSKAFLIDGSDFDPEYELEDGGYLERIKPGGPIRYVGTKNPITDHKRFKVFEGKLYIVVPPIIRKSWIGRKRYVGSMVTSQVTSMQDMFSYIEFNEDISHFDTSNVVSMERMFCYTKGFNQSVSNFDTSKVESMNMMFRGCTSFRQDVKFDMKSVTDASEMFSRCPNFNGNVELQNTSGIKKTIEMFMGCVSLNKTISLDLKSVNDARRMFRNVGPGLRIRIKNLLHTPAHLQPMLDIESLPLVLGLSDNVSQHVPLFVLNAFSHVHPDDRVTIKYSIIEHKEGVESRPKQYVVLYVDESIWQQR